MNFSVEAIIGAGKSTLAEQRQNLHNASADVLLFERSLNSSKLVFQKTLAEDGSLSNLQSHILDKLYSALTVSSPKMHGIIYLKVIGFEVIYSALLLVVFHISILS